MSRESNPHDFPADSSVPSFGAPANNDQPDADVSQNGSRWIASGRFLAAWLFPAAMGFYLKWVEMVDQNGFARVSRSMGFRTLALPVRLGFFRGEIVTGLLLVPLVLLLIHRYFTLRWSAFITGALSGGFVIVFTIQILALDEVGRYLSLDTIANALHWGWHEPGANAGYLAIKPMLACLAAMTGMGMAIEWAAKTRRRPCSNRIHDRWRTAAELHLFGIFVLLAIAWKSDIPKLAYHESVFVRAVASLWKGDAVDTGEFAALDSGRMKELDTRPISYSSEAELVARYREFVHAPVPDRDPRYFGREREDNVLFFILETVPDKFLPADDDMKQFPNLARLREKSFVATRHYTSFPFTRCALFSLFTSWYPIDGTNYRGFPDGDVAPDFFHRLDSAGYETAAFSPLHSPGDDDESLYSAVGIRNHFFLDAHAPLPAVNGYEGQPPWKAARIGADLAALHSMEAQLAEWLRTGRKFAVAFVPQVGHIPYPDSWPGDSSQNLRERGRSVIVMQDRWLGKLMDLLAEHGQMEKTLIVVLGDHGPRTDRENPSLRRGTIDETAFHTPLLIYAPRTLDHTEKIPWLTSHIDVIPTVLDLLGVEEARDSEQGAPVWNRSLAQRTTFLIAKPIFGTDGYVSNGKFSMWHYLSDSVYVNSQAAFDTANIVPRRSDVAQQVTSNIATMVALEKAWHAHFAEPARKNRAEPKQENSAPHPLAGVAIQ